MAVSGRFFWLLLKRRSAQYIRAQIRLLPDLSGCLATCEELTGLVKRFRKSRSTIQNHKDRLSRLIKAHLGDDILQQIQEQPGWHNDMRVTREKLACRWERSTI